MCGPRRLGGRLAGPLRRQPSKEGQIRCTLHNRDWQENARRFRFVDRCPEPTCCVVRGRRNPPKNHVPESVPKCGRRASPAGRRGTIDKLRRLRPSRASRVAGTSNRMRASLPGGTVRTGLHGHVAARQGYPMSRRIRSANETPLSNPHSTRAPRHQSPPASSVPSAISRNGRPSGTCVLA